MTVIQLLFAHTSPQFANCNKSYLNLHPPPFEWHANCDTPLTLVDHRMRCKSIVLATVSFTELQLGLYSTDWQTDRQKDRRTLCNTPLGESRWRKKRGDELGRAWTMKASDSKSGFARESEKRTPTLCHHCVMKDFYAKMDKKPPIRTLFCLVLFLVFLPRNKNAPWNYWITKRGNPHFLGIPCDFHLLKGRTWPTLEGGGGEVDRVRHEWWLSKCTVIVAKME